MVSHGTLVTSCGAGRHPLSRHRITEQISWGTHCCDGWFLQVGEVGKSRRRGIKSLARIRRALELGVMCIGLGKIAEMRVRWKEEVPEQLHGKAVAMVESVVECGELFGSHAMRVARGAA